MNKKTDFISSILPEIERAKDRVGGIAEKIPASLVLAQAIHESGWGTSNFARERKNLFGVKTVKVIRKHKSVHKVMVYKSFNRVGEGIRYYLSNYASNDDYEELRRYLSKGSGTHTLIRHLGNYAQDPEYARKLKKIIDDNNLLVFDSGFEEWDRNIPLFLIDKIILTNMIFYVLSRQSGILLEKFIKIFEIVRKNNE